jgi:hypothetical protein
MGSPLLASVTDTLAEMGECERSVGHPFPAFAGMMDLFSVFRWGLGSGATTCGGRIIMLSTRRYLSLARTENDHVVAVDDYCPFCRVDQMWKLPRIHDAIVAASELLGTVCALRVVVHSAGECCAVAVGILVAVCADLQRHRRSMPPLPDDAPSAGLLPSVLHDVLSALYGDARRNAATVCRQWRRMSCDPLLLVDRDDVTSWLRPLLVELQRRHKYSLHPYAAAMAWSVIRHWLQQW